MVASPEAPSRDRTSGAPEADAGQGALHLEDLAPGARLNVRTADATYELSIVAPRLRQVVIRGGEFPVPAGVEVDGCSREGTFLEIGTIRIGCAVELRTERGRVVTRPVRSLGLVHLP